MAEEETPRAWVGFSFRSAFALGVEQGDDDAVVIVVNEVQGVVCTEMFVGAGL